MTQTITVIPSLRQYISGIILRFAAALRVDGETRGIRHKFADAVRVHDAMIRRICFGYARTADDLDDLYQDVLVNIWQGLPRYRGESSMKTWIYRVTLNTCVSTLRSRGREPNGMPVTELLNIADDSQERQTEIRELHECIATLGPIDKAIVMLWLDEYSYEEIADMTGLKRNNVATRLHRAKEKLKTIYENGR